MKETKQFSEVATGRPSLENGRLPQFPYPGLRPFHEDEGEIFFGRFQQIAQLIEILRRTNFLSVVGPSGCGKSSLIHAGLLPKLNTGLLLGGQGAWRFAKMRPGSRPVAALADAIVRSGGLTIDTEAETDLTDEIGILYGTLLRGPLGLIEALEETPLRPYTKLLLLVDQFEELFRYSSDGPSDEADALVRILLETALHASEGRKAHSDDDPFPVYIVLTMRTDYLGECNRFPGLPEAINDSQFLTPRMTRDQRRAAITGPAYQHNGHVTGGLINQLLNDMGDNSDQLPIMQHALMRMWTEAIAPVAGDDPVSIELNCDLYEAVGGWNSTLSRHADEAFFELGDRGQRIAEKLFRCLSESGPDGRGVRRPVSVEEVVKVAEAVAPNVSHEEVTRVIETFQRAHRNFLVVHPALQYGDKELVDISHESLIRQWDKLREWVIREERSADEYLRLEQRAIRKKDHADDYLRPPALDIALKWQESEQPSETWASRYGNNFELAMQFLAESRQEWQRIKEEKRRIKEQETQRNLQLAAERARANEAAARQKEVVEHAERQQRTNGFLKVAISIAAAAIVFALYQLYETTQARKIANERLSYQYLMQGTKSLQSGDVAHALHWYAEDLMHAENNGNDYGLEVNRLRISAGLRQLPTLANFIEFPATEERQLGPRDAEVWRDPDTDTSELAVAYGNEAQVWDLAQNKQIAVLPHGSNVNLIAFSPDGNYLVTAGAGLKVWDLKQIRTKNSGRAGTHRPRLSSADQEDLRKICSSVTSVNFHPHAKITSADGKESDPSYQMLLIIDEERDNKFEKHSYVNVDAGQSGGAILLSWEPGDDMFTSRRMNSEGVVRTASFSKNGKFLVTGVETRVAGSVGRSASRLQVWNVEDPAKFELVWSLDSNRNPDFVQFSPDASCVLAVTNDPVKGEGQVLLWQGDQKRLLDPGSLWKRGGIPLPSINHKQPVRMASFSPDGRYVISASDDATAHLLDLWLWNEEEGTRILLHGSSVFWGAFSPDARFILTGSRDRLARVWDVATGELELPPLHHSGTVTQALFNPDSGGMITLSEDAVSIWTLDTSNQREPALPISGTVHGAAASTDFSHVGAAIELPDGTGEARVWNVSNGSPVLVALFHHTRAVRNALLSTSGEQLATVTDNNVVHVWSLKKKRRLFKIPQDYDVRQLAFDHDGSKLLVSGSEVGAARGAARVYDLSGKTECVKPACERPVVFAGFSPDGDLAITAGGSNAQGFAQVCNASDGGAVLQFPHPDGVVLHADLSKPIGSKRLLLTSCDDDQARIWNVASGKEEVDIFVHEGLRRMHTADVVHAEFDSNARHVVTASKDQTAKIWHLEQDDRFHMSHILEHPSFVQRANFSPDDDFIITFAFDNILRIWDREHGKLVAAFPHRGKVAAAGFAQDRVVKCVSLPLLPFTSSIESSDSYGRLSPDASDDSLSRAGSDALATGPAGSISVKTWDFSPVPYSDAVLRDFCSLLSMQALADNKVGASESLTGLEPTELATIWRDLSALHPRSPTQVDHQWTANRCQAEKRWFAAYWHSRMAGSNDVKSLVRWLEENFEVWKLNAPGKVISEYSRWILHEEQLKEVSWELYYGRARVLEILAYERVEDYPQDDVETKEQLLDAAIEDYRRAAKTLTLNVGLESSDVSYFRNLALLQLAANDVQGYQRLCRQLLNDFGDTQSSRVASRVAWTCCMTPNFLSEKEFKRMRDLADVAGDATLFGLVQYRDGNLDAAHALLAGRSDADSNRLIDTAVRQLILSKVQTELEKRRPETEYKVAANEISYAAQQAYNRLLRHVAIDGDRLELDRWFSDSTGLASPLFGDQN